MAKIRDTTPMLEGDRAIARQLSRKRLGVTSSIPGIKDSWEDDRLDIVTEERMEKRRAIYEKCKPVALEILEEARSALAVRFRFLDSALWRMPLHPSFDVYGIASDGHALYFDPVYVIDRFKISFNEVVRDVIHCLFHCIFRQPFMLYSVLRQPWDVACDIAIESMILDLVGDIYPSNMDRRARESLKVLRAHVGGVITAERLYWFFGNEGNKTDLKSLAPMFYHDSHSLWYGDEDLSGTGDVREIPDGADSLESRPGASRQGLQNEFLDAIVEGPDEGDEDTNGNAEMADEGASDPCLEADGGGQEGGDPHKDRPFDDEGRGQGDPDLADVDDQWKGIGEKILVDLETHLAKRGEGAGSIIDQLRALNRERCDYTEFLRRFCSLHESMRINDDEFDYIYYTFGMNRYGNMPLIEPLEYMEDRRIRDFVVAIDTSESCSGEVVQAFLNKTYNILKSSESFHDRVNIHLIQCDAAIQDITRISSLDQLELYMKDLELRGFGGTDFRPVFEYVDEMLAKGEFADLRGLIYFTDGEGVFPKRPPEYDAAFVFLDDGYTDPEVPPWAIKAILDINGLKDKRDKGETL